MIGEQNHRWFILFLWSCISSCACVGVGTGVRLISVIADELPTLQEFLYILLISHADLTWATVTCAAVVGSLLIFVLQQMHRVSTNVTTIEVGKYQNVILHRIKQGIKTPIHNFYDKGFLANWRSVIFPPKPQLVTMTAP